MEKAAGQPFTQISLLIFLFSNPLSQIPFLRLMNQASYMACGHCGQAEVTRTVHSVCSLASSLTLQPADFLCLSICLPLQSLLFSSNEPCSAQVDVQTIDCALTGGSCWWCVPSWTVSSQHLSTAHPSPSKPIPATSPLHMSPSLSSADTNPFKQSESESSMLN